ncbi:Peptidyl-Lys metalloendopeptidase [Varanus komodoensis]|nr:Peptidyl-Lys metalloendopeptidase [Varanus komodoensis]
MAATEEVAGRGVAAKRTNECGGKERVRLESSEEGSECFRVGEGSMVKKRIFLYSKKLNEEEATIAAAAKEGALEILRDALKKKHRVLMRVPEKVVLQGGDGGGLWMDRHAILTEGIVKELLAELGKVRFKKGYLKPSTHAYVFRNDVKRTIYLCNPFWKSPKYLQQISQPATLIHEVAHFLGAKDFAYKPSTIALGCRGSVVKDCAENGAAGSPPDKGGFWDALRNAFWNARNIESEFALTINHKGKYKNGKYACCGETARYSVCEQSVPDHFYSCHIDETWKTEILLKKLTIHNQRKLHKIVDAMKRSLKNSKTEISIMLSAGTAMLSSIVGLLLAPATFGFSLLGAAAAASVPMGLAFVICSVAYTGTCKQMDNFSKWQYFLDGLQKFIKFLNDGGELSVYYRQEVDFYTFLVKVLVLMKEGTKS